MPRKTSHRFVFYYGVAVGTALRMASLLLPEAWKEKLKDTAGMLS